MRSDEMRWTQVRVGLFVALALLLAFGTVAALGVAGSPLKRRAHLHGMFDDVSGLAVGSPIEMGGVVVGEIKNIDLPDLATAKVPVRFAVDRAALEKLGPSSTAFTGSHALVGQRFIGLTTRKPDEPQLKDGDQITAAPTQTPDAMIDEARAAVSDLRAMIKDLRDTTQSIARAGDALDKGEGTLGALLHDRELYERLSTTARRLDDLAAKAANGDGAIATLIGDPQVGRELKDSVGALARTAQRVDKGQGLLGRLTTEGTASQRLDRTLANVEAVSSKLAEAKGTLGALISDPALLGRMNELVGQMDSLVSDVRRNPQRYLKLEPF